jgi:hypothetical protein
MNPAPGEPGLGGSLRSAADLGVPSRFPKATVGSPGRLAAWSSTTGIDVPDEDGERAPAAPVAPPTGEHLVTSTRYRVRLTDSDRLILAARFEEYLNWRHVGAPSPRSAKAAAERIGWLPHTVAKRCENIRSRYSRLGVPGLHGSRALDELATLLISTGELTAEDLRRLPTQPRTG